MKNLIIFVGVTLFLNSCNPPKSEQKNSYFIKKISVSTTTCYGKCPEMDISIDDSGNVTYYGGEYSNPKGFQTARLSKEQWAFIKERAIVILNNYESDSILPQNVIDDSRYDIIVTSDKKKIRILGYQLFYPKEAFMLLGAVQKTQRELSFKPCKDSLKFETKREGK